jgi:outer membrane protein TolC
MSRSFIAALLSVLSIGAAAARPLAAQNAPRTLTLDEAIAQALLDNAGLKAMRQKVTEQTNRKSWMFSNYLPRISTMGMYLGTNNENGIMLPAGSLGNFPPLGGAFPPIDGNVPDVGKSFGFLLTTVAQPVTQIFKIRQGVGVVRADESVAEAQLRRTEQDVAFGVLQAYAGVVLAEHGRRIAAEKVAATELRVGYQTAAVSAGSAADVVGREARVRWLQSKEELLEREGEFEDLSYKLADAIGLDAGTQIQLSDPTPLDAQPGALEDYVASALRDNPEVLEARALVSKASHGVGAAKADYIPEVGVLGGHAFQPSLPYLPKNMLMFGVSGKVTLFDFGARQRTLGERRAQLSQAELNLEMVTSRVRGDVEAAYRKVTRAKQLVELATEALSLRAEGARLRIVQARIGYAVPAQEHEANAEGMEAKSDLLKAQLGYRIAWAELQKASGTLAVR